MLLGHHQDRFISPVGRTSDKSSLGDERSKICQQAGAVVMLLCGTAARTGCPKVSSS